MKTPCASTPGRQRQFLDPQKGRALFSRRFLKKIFLGNSENLQPAELKNRNTKMSKPDLLRLSQSFIKSPTAWDFPHKVITRPKIVGVGAGNKILQRKTPLLGLGRRAGFFVGLSGLL